VAAALAGIPATTRETNHAVILATGHRALDQEALESWEKIARTGQPVVLYMAMSKLADIAAAFLRAGLAPDTPVAVLASATFEDERVLETKLASAADDVKVHGVQSPAIVIVGRIAALRGELGEALRGWRDDG
jgi:uroporphyrin-III C-methyltransferase